MTRSAGDRTALVARESLLVAIVALIAVFTASSVLWIAGARDVTPLERVAVAPIVAAYLTALALPLVAVVGAIGALVSLARRARRRGPAAPGASDEGV